jgi:DNA-binding transcriptional regulator YdaS (Cro superfamily)
LIITNYFVYVDTFAFVDGLQMYMYYVPMKKIKAVSIVLSHLGTQAKVAEALGVKQQNISFWINSPTVDMPIDLFPVAAKAIGVRPQDLRPDIFNALPPSAPE